MPEPAPSRAVAAILAFALPPGVGQAYLGLGRRAVVWFVVFLLLTFAVPVAVPTLGATLGYRATAIVYLAAIAARWIAPLMDVLLVKRERFLRTQTGLLIGLAGGGVVAALVGALTTRVFFLEAFKIPSGAMIPTLVVGDHLFVDKLAYRTRAPRYGEVMVFAFPEHPEQDFIKRVIVLPGDRLDVKGGHPWINGWEVPHCKVGTFSYDEAEGGMPHHGELDVEFLGEQAYLTFYDAATGGFTDRQGPFAAKPGEYWVMGDNRNNSHDSRMWFGGKGGGVPKDLVRGHALFVWLSIGEGGIDGHRTGQAVEGPTLPKGNDGLQGALDVCMTSGRPPASRTQPPPP
jgi:signal peptidase I